MQVYKRYIMPIYYFCTALIVSSILNWCKRSLIITEGIITEGIEFSWHGIRWKIL